MPIVRYIPDPDKPADFSPEDRAYLAALTDEQKIANALSDPDNPPLTDAQLARMDDINALRRVRRATGLTQEEFAAAIGATVGTIRNWEQGRSVPGAVERRLYRAIERDPAGVLTILRAAAE